MEFRTMVLWQFLVIALFSLTMGLLIYKDDCNGNYISLALSSSSSSFPSNAFPEVIDLDHDDLTMYEEYWERMGEYETTVEIPGLKFISHFFDVTSICWFLETEFANAVIKMHDLVGNAVTDDRYIVVGTGSSHLYQAALYALSPLNATKPIDVMSSAPFHSSYPLRKSGLYNWSGDAREFNKDEPYIDRVTSPNNRDVLLIRDLTYYWPQYTTIKSRADHDIMLFTVSKSTGHAGSRLGWAILKDREITKKMTEYISVCTIEVSKESQQKF